LTSFISILNAPVSLSGIDLTETVFLILLSTSIMLDCDAFFAVWRSFYTSKVCLSSRAVFDLIFLLGLGD
jgi:hypothetical protein